MEKENGVAGSGTGTAYSTQSGAGDGGNDSQGASGAQGVQSDAPKFTQEQLNGFLAKEAGIRESKILAELGLKSKDELAALKKKLDEGKTEEQRRAEALEAEKKRADELDGKVKASDLIIELLSMGMDKENARKYAKFAAEETGETAEEKAKAFIAANDGLVKKTARDVGIVTGGRQLNTNEAILGDMKKRFKVG